MFQLSPILLTSILYFVDYSIAQQTSTYASTVTSLVPTASSNVTEHDDDHDTKKLKKALIGGLAGIGGLLLLLMLLSTCCLCWRYGRKVSRKEQHSDPSLVISRVAKPNDVETPDELPPLESRRTTRRLSAPMAPIPETSSPRASVEKRAVTLPPNEQLVTKKPNPTPHDPFSIKDPAPAPVPVVQRNVQPSSTSPPDTLVVREPQATSPPPASAPTEASPAP